MKLSKLSFAVVAASLLAAGAAQAEVTSSGSVGFTTDYKYRGLSQTDSSPAIQGALTLSHDSGFYFSVWGSSVDSVISAGELEIDPSIGYTFSSGDVTYDVGVLQYGYPEDSQKNFTEVYGSVAYAGAKLGVAYSPDFYAETGKSLYTYVSYGTEVSGFGVSASLGYNKFDDDFYDPIDGYLDYKLGVSKAVAGLTVEVAYIGTDIKDKDYGVAKDKDGQVIATVSKAF